MFTPDSWLPTVGNSECETNSKDLMANPNPEPLDFFRNPQLRVQRLGMDTVMALSSYKP